jgi:predicted nucleotidyltransferase
MMDKTTHEKFMIVVESLIEKKLRKEPLQAIILGGSVARGDETEHSDIDIVFYVKKKDIPKNPRSFYKFKGKYIEEHYSAIENLRNDDILPESKILYDKTGKLKNLGFDKNASKINLKVSLKEANKFQKIAGNYFKNDEYEKAFYYLYGLESPAFIIMHSLPPNFNLPFPSFRLLKSVKIIDKKHKTKIYEKIKGLYTFKNNDSKLILSNFKKAYLLMNKIKRSENKDLLNLGFFDEMKVKYNLDGLQKTFEDYPFVFANRFIVGCLVMWVFDKNVKGEDKKILHNYLMNILGIEKINEKILKEKLNLSKDLLKECKKLFNYN